MPIIRLDNTTFSEADGLANLVFSLSQASTQNVSFEYSAGSGTTSSYNDYTHFSGTLSFAPGQTSISISVPVTNDSSAETTEVMFVNMYAAQNADLERTSAALTIIDNDAAVGIPLISIRDTVVDESRGFAQFVVSLDRPASGDVSVSYDTQNGTAAAGSDYSAQSGVLLFRAGETAKTISVPILNDNVAESAETFNVLLSQANGGTLAQSLGRGRIALSDLASVDLPQIRMANATVSEHDGFADILFSLNAPSQKTVSVEYSAGPGTTSSYNDYTHFSGTLKFAPGETSKTLRVAIENDSRAETNEVMFINLSNAVNATFEHDSAALRLIDDDAEAGQPAISVTDCVIDKASGIAHFTVSLNKPSTSMISVPYATADDSALAGQDYLAQSGNLVFRPGETAQTIEILLANSTVARPASMFNLELAAPTGGASLANAIGHGLIAAHGATASALPMIRVAPSVVFSEADAYVDVVVSLDAPSNQMVSVRYEAGPGSTSSYNDYVHFSGTLKFAPGETSKSVRVAINNDASAESIESLFVNFYSPVNALLERTSTALTMIDNDAAPGVPALSVNDSVVDEKNGYAEFAVTLDKPASSDVSVSYSTQDGSAKAGSDYLAQNGSIVFRAGETSQTIRVLVNQDNPPEAAERFSLVLSTPSNATLADGVGTVEIPAHRPLAANQIQIQVADTIVSEADGFADVHFSLSGASTQNISVKYAYANGTTSSYNDLVQFSGTLNFAPGVTSQTLRVAIYNDSSVEANETFLVSLSAAVNASLQRSSATVTIVNDDSGGRFLHYGMGDDVYQVNSSSDIVSEQANNGIDLVRFTMADYTAADHVENLQGNALNNQLTGNQLNNCLNGGAGNDVLQGGMGIDTAQFNGPRSNFTISKTSTGFTVTDLSNAEGVDSLLNVERIKFSDMNLALDSSGLGGQAYRLYQAAFNRTPDAGGLGYWMSALERGASLQEVANGFVVSPEFQALYGSNPSNAEIVSRFYENVLHRPGEAGGYNFWLGILNNQQGSRADVLAAFSESPENQDALINVIGTGFAYLPYEIM